MSWLAGDLSGLLMPRDLEVLRDTARTAYEAGEDLVPLYRALADKEPLALGDLALGPKAIPAIDAAIEVIDAIEKGATPAAVYRRLMDLAPARACELLALACERHPAASFAIALSEQHEEVVGRTHLRAAKEHPALLALALGYARKGHTEALVELAGEGRPEPLAALAVTEHDDAWVIGAARAIDADPACPLVPFTCAARGASARALIRRVLPHLKSREAAERLQHDLSPFPEERKLLALLSAGMRTTR